MKQYLAGKIRNVALAGHSSSGKTTLAEALLYKTGYSDRLGKVADGNTVCDFDPEEIKRKVSVSSTVAPFAWGSTKINLIDTPGLFDFEGGMYEGMIAAESLSLIHISGSKSCCSGPGRQQGCCCWQRRWYCSEAVRLGIARRFQKLSNFDQTTCGSWICGWFLFGEAIKDED